MSGSSPSPLLSSSPSPLQAMKDEARGHTLRCKRRSFACAASILTALVLPTLLLVSKYSDKNEDEGKHFYPDLVSRQGIECPEINAFLGEYDPFYSWALSSSLPTILSTTAGIDIEVANSAYQLAGAWRVVSNWTTNNASIMYASSDPHVAGGHVKQRRTNLLWTMRVNWGVSIRMCLTIGNGGRNRSCLWTTPVVATGSGEEDLAHLFISTPYRSSTPASVTPDLENAQESPAGMYLTNYASTARADFIRNQTLDKASSFYITNVSSCPFLPSYYSLDALSYLAFPGLQCGCTNSSATRVCVIATKNMDTDSWGLFDSRASCTSLKSYWAWNTGGIYRMVLSSYNASSGSSVPFVATFTDNTTLTGAVSSIEKEALQVMVNTTACVERSMQLSVEDVISTCTSNQMALSAKNGTYYLALMRRSLWVPIPRIDNSSSSCITDQPPGQLRFKDNVCTSGLDAAISKEIRGKVESRMQLRDVTYKQNKAWKNRSDNRHSVYTGILAAVVSLVGSCWAATSGRLLDFEESVADWVQTNTANPKTDRSCWFSFSCLASLIKKVLPERQSTTMFWMKNTYRACIVLGAAALLLYTTYISIKGVEQDRDFLQANTVRQALTDGSVILITTTATYLVESHWAVLYIICVFTVLIVAMTLFYAGHQLEKEDKGTDEPA